MQKKLIALAVAGLASTAAFAQSNVTIYGVADATFESVKASGATTAGENYNSRNRVQSNSSYIGFKGAEDLGNGLKAVFQFENGLNTENGAAGAWNNRDSFVGLTGGFGTLVAGNLTGPTRALGAKLDVNAGATGIGANTALLGKLGGGAGASAFDQRIQNAVAYVSPTFSGFSGVVAYSSGFTGTGNATAAGAVVALAGREAVGNQTAQAASTANTAWTAGLNYAAGPVEAGYAYTVVRQLGADNDVSNHRVGGIFKFAAGQVGLLWDQTRAQQVGADVKQNVWFLAGKFNVTPNGAIIGQYGVAGDLKNVANASDYGAKQFVLGYEHALSKRTTLKAVYSQVNNDRLASYDYLYGVSAPASTATAAYASEGTNLKGFAVGVRHAF